MSLASLLADATFDGETFHADIGPGWLQGRTAYGGASAAIALSAVKRLIPDLPPLRSAQIAFVGPLAGDVKAKPVLLRRGKNSAFFGCDVTNGNGVGLRALFLFMAARPSEIRHDALAMPEVQEPERSVPPSDDTLPGFLDNFTRASTGLQREAGFLRWMRLKDREALDPEIELLAIADALPPAAMALASRWGPISTTTWQLNLISTEIANPGGWWLLETATLDAADGASSQAMTIWKRNGFAVATATQSVALFI